MNGCSILHEDLKVKLFFIDLDLQPKYCGI